MRREGAGIVLVDIGLGPKKRDLKADRLAALGGQPTGDVPPLRAKLRVTAVVLRKYRRLIGRYRCIGGPPSRSHPPPARIYPSRHPKSGEQAPPTRAPRFPWGT